MEYNEKHFKASANKKARVVWIILLVLVTLAHAPQIGEEFTAGNFITMVLLGWIPYLFGRIMCKLKGEDWVEYKKVVAIGYGIFYAYAICVSPFDLAFIYIFPLITMMVLFNDYIFLIKICILNDAVLLLSALVFYIQGTTPAGYVNDLPLEISTITLCYIGCILSVKHITSSNDALTGSIQGNLESVVNSVNKV